MDGVQDMMPTIDLSKKRKLVLEGGGVKGAAFGGALTYFEEKGVLKQINEVAGSSAGGITAFLLAGGLSAGDINKIIESLDFETFKDDTFGVLRDINRLLGQYGWHKGDKFLEWAFEMAERMFGDPNMTFGQLEASIKAGNKNYKLLHLTACNLRDLRSEVFSHEGTPDIKIADALRATMSLPLFFTPHKINGAMYVDGGLTRNYPIKLFDKVIIEEGIPRRVYNHEVIGLRLDSKDEIRQLCDHEVIPGKNPDGIIEATQRVLQLAAGVQTERFDDGPDNMRTIFIDTLKIKTTQFDLTQKDKHALGGSGYNCCIKACGPACEDQPVPSFNPGFDASKSQSGGGKKAPSGSSKIKKKTPTPSSPSRDDRCAFM